MKKLASIAILFLGIISISFAQDYPTCVILLAGQSNMAGRGSIRKPADTITYDNIFSMDKDSVWVRAKNPLHWDKSGAGVGPGLSFAAELSKKFNDKVNIYLVPCAAGGTTIDMWKDNKLFSSPTCNINLYSNLINRAKKAEKKGNIIGIMWHQGESDAVSSSYSSYQSKLKSFINKVRTDLNFSDLPFIAGEMGTYFQKSPYPFTDSITKYINNLMKEVSNYGVVSSKDLKSNSDFVHFNSESQVSFGKRYAEAFFSEIFKVRLEDTLLNNGNMLNVPLNIDLFRKLQLTYYQFNLNYNTSKLKYTGFNTDNTLSKSTNITVTEISSGVLKITCKTQTPIIKSGTILNLQFNSLVSIETPILSNSLFTSDAISSVFIETTDKPVNVLTNINLKEKNEFVHVNTVGNKLFTSLNTFPINFSVYDITGKCLINKTINNSWIDIKMLPSGIYIGNIIKNNNTSCFKFEKK